MGTTVVMNFFVFCFCSSECEFRVLAAPNNEDPLPNTRPRYAHKLRTVTSIVLCGFLATATRIIVFCCMLILFYGETMWSTDATPQQHSRLVSPAYRYVFYAAPPVIFLWPPFLFRPVILFCSFSFRSLRCSFDPTHPFPSCSRFDAPRSTPSRV